MRPHIIYYLIICETGLDSVNFFHSILIARTTKTYQLFFTNILAIFVALLAVSCLHQGPDTSQWPTAQTLRETQFSHT